MSHILLHTTCRIQRFFAKQYIGRIVLHPLCHPYDAKPLAISIILMYPAQSPAEKVLRWVLPITPLNLFSFSSARRLVAVFFSLRFCSKRALMSAALTCFRDNPSVAGSAVPDRDSHSLLPFGKGLRLRLSMYASTAARSNLMFPSISIYPMTCFSE